MSYLGQIATVTAPPQTTQEMPKARTEETAAGAEPQKILTMRSGLEIPAELLNRDMARKRAKAEETRLLLEHKPSKLLQLGRFASANPLQATLMALAIGAALGSFFYDSRH